MKVSTRITVRVIARDGKFLGDDIGGASVTIRDAQTKTVSPLTKIAALSIAGIPRTGIPRGEITGIRIGSI